MIQGPFFCFVSKIEEEMKKEDKMSDIKKKDDPVIVKEQKPQPKKISFSIRRSSVCQMFRVFFIFICVNEVKSSNCIGER